MQSHLNSQKVLPAWYFYSDSCFDWAIKGSGYTINVHIFSYSNLQSQNNKSVLRCTILKFILHFKFILRPK